VTSTLKEKDPDSNTRAIDYRFAIADVRIDDDAFCHRVHCSKDSLKAKGNPLAAE